VQRAELLKKVYALRDEFILKYHNRVFYGYQLEPSNKIIEAALFGQGKEFYIEISRQSGKTEMIVLTIEFLLLFVKDFYEEFGIELATEGWYVVIGAPQQEQGKTDFDRIKEYLLEPCKDFGISFSESNGTTLKLSNGNICYCFPVSPTANIESKTAHLILLEESQDIPDVEKNKKVIPMGTACVCKKTKLINSKGDYIDITMADSKVLGFSEEEGLIMNDVVNNHSSGLKSCVKITTNAGRILECSDDHPIMVKPRDTRRLEYLKARDTYEGLQVAIIDKNDVFLGKKRFFDARMIGMLIGDGSYRGKSLVRFCSCDKELLEYARKYPFKSYNSYTTKDGKLFEEGTIRGLAFEMRKIGLEGQTGKDKRLPESIQDYTREDVCALIGGLFDTDGCVSIEEDRRVRIKLSSSGDKLLWDVFYLLEKIGIHSRIYFAKAGKNSFGKNGHWNLVISEKISALRFINNIPLIVGYKKGLLERAKLILKRRKNKRQKDMTGLYFERIVKVEDIGTQRVYNLTALQTNNYFANNILTHNTNAPVIYIGTAGYTLCDFYRGLHSKDQENVFIYDCWEVIKQRRLAYENDGKEWHLSYENYIKRQILQKGEFNPEVKSQYFLEWQLEKGMFITESVFEGLLDKELLPVQECRDENVIVGMDVAKDSDVTFLTALKVRGYKEIHRKIPAVRNIEVSPEIRIAEGTYDPMLTNPVTKAVTESQSYFEEEVVRAPIYQVLNWFMINGALYQSQWEAVDAWLERWNVWKMNIDSTGSGDATGDYYLEKFNGWDYDMLKRYEKNNCRGTVRPVKFSAQSKNVMFVNLDIVIKEGRLVVPAKMGGFSETERMCFNRFRAEMLSALREWRGSLLNVRHPDKSKGESGDMLTDDSVDSLALTFFDPDASPEGLEIERF